MLASALPWLWIPITLVAAAAQTARNAMQRSLTETLGTVGATQVRFLYGFPFALVFLALVCLALDASPPSPDGSFLAFVLAGALAQIVATALMLAAMRERSFSVTTAYLKTEPVQVALFGVAVLGEHLPPVAYAAILVATAGVVLMAWKPGAASGSGLRPAVLGVGAGAFFALSAIGFRGGVLELGDASFVLRATTTLVWSLGVQTLLLLVWLAAFNRVALIKSFKAWRASLFAGFMGAFGSQFWFLGFALTSAANVRTLALVEVIFAQIVSRRIFDQNASRRDLVGMALIVIGVGLLMAVQG
jgi:drug/metabolite transporter (DMT)-like permease